MLKTLGLVNINFYKEFSEKDIIPNLYDYVYNKTNSTRLLNKRKGDAFDTKHAIAINFIPPYFDLEPNLEGTDLDFFDFSTHKGFLVNLKDYVRGIKQIVHNNKTQKGLKKVDFTTVLGIFYVLS